MRLILGERLKRIRENVACPQFGDNHYGSWGALRLDQRRVIAQMIETIELLDKELEITRKYIHYNGLEYDLLAYKIKQERTGGVGNDE